MPKLSITDLDLKDKRVFIRVDFNVPLKSTRMKTRLPVRSRSRIDSFDIGNGESKDVRI